MNYDKIFTRPYKGIFYLDGSEASLLEEEQLITDNINCPSKSFIDLYWSVGVVGDESNEELTNKIKEM